MVTFKDSTVFTWEEQTTQSTMRRENGVHTLLETGNVQRRVYTSSLGDAGDSLIAEISVPLDY